MASSSRNNTAWTVVESDMGYDRGRLRSDVRADEAAQAARRTGATPQNIGHAADAGAKTARAELGDARLTTQTSRQGGERAGYGSSGSRRSDAEYDDAEKRTGMEIKTGSSPMSSRQVEGYKDEIKADRLVEIRITPDPD